MGPHGIHAVISALSLAGAGVWSLPDLNCGAARKTPGADRAGIRDRRR